MARHARRGRRRAPKPTNTTGSKVVGVLGEVMLTVGAVVLLFVVYTLWGTGLQTAQAQDDLKEDTRSWLQQQADKPRPKTDPDKIALGDAYAIIRIPRFGDGWGRVDGGGYVIVQGTEDEDLKKGPGHYKDSANPGEVGNFAVAAHRSGHGEPFAQFPELREGDRIEIINAQGTWIYELDDAPNGDPDGNRIDIHDTWVVDPVPGEGPEAEPKDKRITLTTCWPRFGSTHRMYATGTLVKGPDN